MVVMHGPAMTTSEQALDPVCGMTVDPHTTPHRAPASGPAPIISARPAAAPSSPPIPAKYLDARRASRGAGAGRHDLHLPDASRDPAGRPRLLPDLRHGARARDRRPPTAGPNPELADMTRRFWIGLALSLPVFALEMGGHLVGLHGCSASDCRTGSSSRSRRRWCCGPAGRSSCAAGSRSSRATSTCSR